jgi:TolA-binding protein
MRCIYILAAAMLIAGNLCRGQTSTMSVVDSPLAAGRLALEDGFSAVAETAFTACLQRVGLSADDTLAARECLLQALFDQSKFDEMDEKLDVWVAAQELSGAVAAYWRATALFGQAKYAESALLLAPFIDTWGESRWRPAGLRLLGRSRLKSGDVEGACGAFSTYSASYPAGQNQNLNRLDWGKALIFQEALKEAVDVLTPVMLDVASEHLAHEARYWVGKAHLQLGDVETGQAILTPLVTSPDIAEGLRVKAVLVVSSGLARAGDTDGAAKMLGEALSAVPGEASKLSLSFMLCKVLLDGARLDEAIPLVKAHVSGDADSTSAAALQLQLGEALLDGERYDDAILAYQQYLETFASAGGHAQARMGHGWALMGAGRSAEAAVAFEKAYDLFTEPESRMVSLLKVADARFENEQFQQALGLYERFRDEFPDSRLDAEAGFQAGACLVALNQAAEAEAAFKEVAARHGKAAEAGEALLRIGELRYALENWTGAAKAFERVMQRGEDDPLFADALHGRGMARYESWSPDALGDFERIVKEFASTDVGEHALFMQAMSLYRLGRDALALGVCRDFLKRYATSTWAPDVHFWIARFSYNTGDYDAAETAFVGFAEQFEDHNLADRAVYRAGMSAVKRKEYVHAIELFGQLTKRYPSSDRLADARFAQADAMCQLGKFAGAILVFEEVINNYPMSPLVSLAWGRKGDCQFTLGAEDPARYDEAIRSYRVVTQSPQARRDHMLQAEYKIGRCLEKLGREEASQDHYYAKVMVPFLAAKQSGEAISESAKVWFTRASLGAAEIATTQKDWRKLVRILDRIVEANVAVSAEASTRIKTIKSENWWLFY